MDKENLRKREKQSKYGPGTYLEYLVENDDPYTLVNTVLKMAKKRAQVDAALTVASLSEIFTQDLEDFKGITNEGDEPAPVSYTHLDVYKRQVKRFNWPLLLVWIACLLISLGIWAGIVWLTLWILR